MIGRYARLIARCRSVNQVNQAHIVLGDRITPLELRALHRGIAPDSPVWDGGRSGTFSPPRAAVAAALERPRQATEFPPESHEWVEGLADWASRSGRTEPEPYVRRRVAAHVVLYTAGGPSTAKTLVLGFAGRARRLFMPVAAALQHLPAERFDLLLFGDPSKESFRRGLARMAPDFPAFVDGVGALYDRRAYRSVVAYGASGGGLSATVAALRLSLDKGVSVGGGAPREPRWQAVCEGGVEAMLRDGLRAAAAPPNLLLVHSADDEVDADAARATAAVVPARIVPVHATNGPKLGHNALLPMLRRSRLGEFLATALDAEVTGLGGDVHRIDL